MTASLHERLTALPRPETTVIMDRVLEKGRREQEWGTPAILDACIAVAKADPSLGTRVTGFLSERPAGQIKPRYRAQDQRSAVGCRCVCPMEGR